MMTIEMMPPGREFILIGKVLPGVLGSMSNTTEDGRREVYQLEVTQDCAILSRSVRGADAELGESRETRVIISDGFEPVKTLHDGEECVLNLKTDRAPFRCAVRFRFEK